MQKPALSQTGFGSAQEEGTPFNRGVHIHIDDNPVPKQLGVVPEQDVCEPHLQKPVCGSQLLEFGRPHTALAHKSVITHKIIS